MAERSGDVSGDALLPATLSDSITIWPALLRLARTPAVPLETRRTAVFWLGQAAGTAAALTLDSIAGDRAGDREVRKQALFALGQSDDPRALTLFEEILR